MPQYDGLLERTPTPAFESAYSFAGLKAPAQFTHPFSFSGPSQFNTRPFAAGINPNATFGGDQTYVSQNLLAKQIADRKNAQEAERLKALQPGYKYQNPNAASKIAAMYDQFGNLKAGGVTATQKNAQVGIGVANLQTGFADNQAQAKQTIADFTRDYLGTKPQATQYANEEMKSIGQAYGTGPGSVRDELKQLLAQRNAAVRGTTQEALQRAARANSMYRLGSGHSSYADQQYGQTLASIMAQEAVQGSDLARENYLYERQGQNAGLGQRNRILNDLLNRDLMPVQAGQQMLGNSAGLLGSISNLDNQNTYYDYQTPEQKLQQQMGLLGGLMDLENRNRVPGYIP